MKFNPHPYQQHAIDRILNQNNVALFLDMGLGKTSITLTAINELIHNRYEVRKVLIIAPKRVAEDTWTSEASKWDHLKHLKFEKILGTEKQRIKALDNDFAEIYTINRENVDWLCKYMFNMWDFDMVVIDELSSFKSSKSQRFKALKVMMPLTKRVLGLTGTPTPNGLQDLWSQIYLLDQGARLGKTLTAYRDRYFDAGRRNGHIVFNYIPKSGAEKKIYSVISDIAVSMTAKDWLVMPDRINNVIQIKLTDKTMKDYKRLEREKLLGEEITAANAAVVTNKLLQLSSGQIYTDDGKVEIVHDSKLEALGEMIEASNGKPLLVFYQFKHELARIKEKYDVRTLDSSADITDWNEGKIPVLLVHPASAGHGLNLQAGGCTVIWYTLTWSLELYQQANARLHRQGQQHTVIVHHMVCKGTLDEEVMQILEAKETRQDRLIDALKARLAK
jgi:SNF2 family DNA or RNA helicase